jgi:hypothetical protein
MNGSGLQCRASLARQAGAGCAILVGLSLLDGCVPQAVPVRPNAVMQRMLPKPVKPAADGVLMDLITVERPLGDSLVNDELWHSTDPQVLPVTLRRKLAEHGFRVAIVGGQMPQAFDTVVNGSAPDEPNGHHLTVRAGSPTWVTTVGPGVECPAEVAELAKLDESQRGNVTFGLRLIPTRQPDGTVEVQFTPELKYGGPMRHFVASQSGGGIRDWALEVHARRKTLDDLTWAIRFQRGQVALLSCQPDSAGSCGYAFFVSRALQGLMQRLLLIQAEQPNAAAPQAP